MLAILAVTCILFITGVILLAVYYSGAADEVVNAEFNLKKRPQWLQVTGLVFVLLSFLVFILAILYKLNKLTA